jgi:hypothetical protein
VRRSRTGTQQANSEVEAGGAFYSAGGYGVEVAFTEHDVVLALDFDLVAIIGAEQHAILHLTGAHVLAEGDDLGPHQSLGDLRCRRDENATRGAALAFVPRDFHQQAIVEHLDRQLLVRHGGDGTVPTVQIETVTLTTTDPRPKLLAPPTRDQYAPFESVERRCASWTNTSVIEIEMADHFLNGRTEIVAAHAVEFALSPIPT